MTALGWRGDPAQEIPFRAWCRKNLPDTSKGEPFAIIDLDVIMRSWVPCVDEQGAFMFLETKTHGKRSMTGAQIRTFALIDNLLAYSPRYRGFYLLVFSGECFEDSDKVWLNDRQVTEAEVVEHFMCRWPAAPRYEFTLKDSPRTAVNVPTGDRL